MTGEHSSQRPVAIVLDEALPEPRSESDSPCSFESLEGQLCEVSISHDGEYATAVALVPSTKSDGNGAEKQDTPARDSRNHASVAAEVR
jgi:holo-[acyl-carrier protein] synthase